MPMTTQTVTKGILPRVHGPKAKAKQWAKQANSSHKWVASDSDSDELDKDMADLRTKKKQYQQAEESKSDLELIDNNVYQKLYQLYKRLAWATYLREILTNI